MSSMAITCSTVHHMCDDCRHYTKYSTAISSQKNYCIITAYTRLSDDGWYSDGWLKQFSCHSEDNKLFKISCALACMAIQYLNIIVISNFLLYTNQYFSMPTSTGETCTRRESTHGGRVTPAGQLHTCLVYILLIFTSIGQTAGGG